MDKNIAELFRVLNTADLESDGIPEEVTVLLGMSRVGKTTLIRWITNPTSLIGNEDRQCIYVDASNS
jgi:polynucleotide 5'-kinase involved in rRNA processing